jgi:FlaA1/EpsC-like NDP-sugar epimerase
VLTVWLSFYLRLNEFVALSGPVLLPVFASICIAIPIFIFSGLYRAIFRYSGLPAMGAMARAMLLYGVLFASLFTFYGFQGVPRTIGLIQPLLMLILVGASRAFARFWLGGLYLDLVKKSKVTAGIDLRRWQCWASACFGQ